MQSRVGTEVVLIRRYSLNLVTAGLSSTLGEVGLSDIFTAMLVSRASPSLFALGGAGPRDYFWLVSLSLHAGVTI